MKKILLVLVLLTNINFGQVKNELRAVWITNVDSDVLFNDAKIAEAMDYLASIGINTVYTVVWNKGYTLYPSDVMKDEFGIRIWEQFEGRDPLQRVIIEAHRNGIEVIPWFEFGFATSYSQGGGHIIEENPDWALKNKDGELVVKNGFDWMAGTNPEVQDFIISLVTEVLDNYDVDGIQGDDRLPAMPVEGGYDSATVAIYKNEHNGQEPPSNYSNSAWMEWRADKLTEFFGRLKDSVKKRGEDLIVSSTPSVYPWGYQNYLQDSEEWMAEGIPDQFIPQLYRQNLSSYRYELTNQLQVAKSQGYEDKFFAGILAKVGSYVISPDLLISSVQTNRDKGVNGESYFFYEGLRANNNINGDTLKSEFYQEEAILPFRDGKNWRPKATIVNEDDPTVELTGNWEQYSINGFKPNIYLTNSTDPASIEYNMEIPFDAYFHLYTYVVPNTVNYEQAEYTVYSNGDSTKLNVNQKNPANEGWYDLGTYYFEKGNKKVLKISNENMPDGKYITADAAMIMINRKKSPDVVVTSVEEGSNIEDIKAEEKIVLKPNYPNPFNSETIIEYAVPYTTNVKLKVFNVLGEEVRVLVNDTKAPGIYRQKFKTENLPSGVYFYSLKAGGELETKKMLYIR